MDNNVDLNKEIIIQTNDLLSNKNDIDVDNTMETFLLYCNMRCDAISYNVTYTICNEYIVKADSNKKQIAEQTIKGFFTLLKSGIEKMIKEKTNEVRNSINQDNNKKQQELNNVVIKSVGDFYITKVRELIEVIKNIDSTYADRIDDYFLQTVFNNLINSLEDTLKYSTFTINNNLGANISRYKEIINKTIK